MAKRDEGMEREREREDKVDCSLSTHLFIWGSPFCKLIHANPEELLGCSFAGVDLSILM